MKLNIITKSDKSKSYLNNKNENKILKNQTGITLIALVVTIVVLLILAGVSINTVFSDEGIINQAQKVGEKWNAAEQSDLEGINSLNNLLNNYINGKIMTNTSHSETTLSYTWEEINKIAKEISNNDDTITKSTSEVTLGIDGTSYTIGVGDTITLKDTSNNSYTVRVLGFNHDKLTSTAAYGGNNTYAGISFEFVTFLNTAQMNSSDTTLGGWASCELRSTLNGTTKATLNNASYIKQVNKRYIATYNDANSVTTSNDYLWLLACSEIWNNGYTDKNCPYGYAIANESTMYESGDTQTQYKYYVSKLGSTAFNTETDITKKPNTASGSYWWLRSPNFHTNYSSIFCRVTSSGNCGGLTASDSIGVAPGFSI